MTLLVKIDLVGQSVPNKFSGFTAPGMFGKCGAYFWHFQFLPNVCNLKRDADDKLKQ